MRTEADLLVVTQIMREMRPPLTTDSMWSHLFKEHLRTKGIREIGPLAFTTLEVIRVHVNLNTGVAIVAQQTIADLIGVSVRSISRAINTLRDHDYLVVDHIPGRKAAHYRLIERFSLKDSTGTAVASVRWVYHPQQVVGLQQVLRGLCETGCVGGEQKLHFQPLQITVNVVNGTQVNVGTVKVTNIGAAEPRYPQPGMRVR
jgi:hypothetical protein